MTARWRPLAAWLALAHAIALYAAPAPAQPMPARGTVEALFTPWDDAEGAIVRLLGAARASVQVQAYLLTSRPVTDALLAAHARGVKVELLADAENVRRGNGRQVARLASAGVPVWLETRYAAAHNKLLLVDVASANPAVATGSYNFTYSAQARNAENLLILRGDAALARRYHDNWLRHRGEATAWTGN